MGWHRVMKFCRMVDLGVRQVISPFGDLWPRGKPPGSKIEKSITSSTIVSPVRQCDKLGWTAADRVSCDKQAAAWSVTASVVNYLYFTVIGMWGYTPVRTTGVLVIYLC